MKSLSLLHPYEQPPNRARKPITSFDRSESYCRTVWMDISHEKCVNDKNLTQLMSCTVKACSHGDVATAIFYDNKWVVWDSM